MSRVALVTGGTRGIGAAIAKALKAAGYKVAANYGGNDGGRAEVQGRDWDPGLQVDVSSFDARAEGIKKGRDRALGPIEALLVNNAGITRDAMFHRMKPGAVDGGDQPHQSRSLFNMCRPVIEGMRERTCSVVSSSTSRRSTVRRARCGAGELFRRQGRRTRISARRSRRKLRASGITVNAICPGYINTEMVQAVPKDVLEKSILPQILIGRLGRAGGNRALRRVPRVGSKRASLPGRR